MRTVIAALILLISTAAVSAGRQSRPGARPEDEAAIRKVVTRLQDGWNAGDGKAFASPFAVDADYVVINGMRIKGRDEIDAGHQRIFDTIYKNSNNTASIKSIRFIRDDIAVAHVEWHLKFNDNGATREGTAMNSLVLARDGGEWSIVAFQNTSVAGARK
ncbi:MAG TPA: SgcJ/EcaC family oxidoreductase [Blastocatellia bacterium]|nr:SgcJ/EcaC family oxidoreductase [Blastocatellia bacterium]